MKRLASIAALLLALAAPAAASATGEPLPAPPPAVRPDVSALPIVQRDLRLASEFWAIEQPNLSSPCQASQVLVDPMQDGVGDNGQIIVATDVWAETALDGCTINVAPVAWALGSSGNSNTSYMFCVLIAHEYGHTLGLPDTESIAMMSSDWGRRDDPLCDRSVYGWHWTLHKDREWLRANRVRLTLARRAQLFQAERTAAASGGNVPTSRHRRGSAAGGRVAADRGTPVRAKKHPRS